MSSSNIANAQLIGKDSTKGRRRSRSRRGATIVEFALSWTLFLMLTMVGVMVDRYKGAMRGPDDLGSQKNAVARPVWCWL